MLVRKDNISNLWEIKTTYGFDTYHMVRLLQQYDIHFARFTEELDGKVFWIGVDPTQLDDIYSRLAVEAHFTSLTQL